MEEMTISRAAASARAAETLSEVNVTLSDDLELDLWAIDELVDDPVALSIDPKGRVFYTSAHRQTESEFDIRGHRDWMTASISFQTVEDRRDFLRKTFSEQNEQGERHLKDLNDDGTLDWRDLTVEREEVWMVEDRDGSGYADRAQLYLRDYHEEITDLANGVGYADGKVYIGVGPDLWRTEDTDGDGRADLSESISHGYAVHIGFGSHGMSGVKRGPDGRIYWGIGDIGANIIDQNGKNWKYPNQGVIARSEPDGSNFEIFCAGVRNTHEFDWDKYGNLITEDNDGDHEGERERLVYLIDGSDSGWRINWQFGKYTDPLNNDYKVWMDERMSVPRWEGQASWFLPPIQNYVNGPTGFVFNPGSALGPAYYDHFFVVEFRGTPSNSPIHAFTMTPNGAGFKLDSSRIVLQGLLPTGIDWGADGALYFGDWLTGWDPKRSGRIWKMDTKDGGDVALREDVKQLLATNWSTIDAKDFKNYLAHADRRIRLAAQFELVDRNELDVLLINVNNVNDIARIHAIWGVGQLARRDRNLAGKLLPWLEDSDPEVVTQVLRVLGDAGYAASEQIIPLLRRPEPRIQLMAIQALGRMDAPDAAPEIIDVVRRDNGQDNWLRHAAMIALGRLGDANVLKNLKTDPSLAVRALAVTSLRRMQHESVAVFLDDPSEYVAAEAARAINDDWSIEAALPQLAASLDNPRWTGEPLLRRAINANLRVGTDEALERLLSYAQQRNAPAAMRAEAIAAASTWYAPSVLDRVDGRYRGVITRERTEAHTTLWNGLDYLFSDPTPEVKVEMARATGRLDIEAFSDKLYKLVQQSRNPEVSTAALRALQEMNSPELPAALDLAFNSNQLELRKLALELLPASDLPNSEVANFLAKILETGTVGEQQTALAALAKVDDPKAGTTIGLWMAKLKSGELASELHLDVVEALRARPEANLQQTLTAYETASYTDDDPLSRYREALTGGDADRGQSLFYSHEAAQCVRCHTVWEYGGNAGPSLEGVGERLSREKLLESLIAPSAEYAMGYEVLSVKLRGAADRVTGTVLHRSPTEIRLRLGENELRTVRVADIEDQVSVPSSMIAMGDIMTKMEMRDMIAFLAGL